MFHFPINLSQQSVVQLPICGNGIAPILRMPEVRHVNGNLGSTKISNITNSSDPQAICARLFVGNLNTLVLPKDDVEAIFRRYGEIVGISMHKGYAFIQYDIETDARNAVTGEDHRVYAGKQIDVNLAAEPRKKPRRKRFYEAITNGSSSRPDAIYSLPNKQARDSPLSSRHLIVEPDEHCLPVPHPAMNDVTHSQQSEQCLFVNGYNPEISDILICGKCKQLFTHLGSFVDHKHQDCSSSTHCQCHGKTRSTSTYHSDEDTMAPSTYSIGDKSTESDRVSSPGSQMDQSAVKHGSSETFPSQDLTHEGHPTSTGMYPVSPAGSGGHVTS